MNEWELLEIAEDIEPGDRIKVESNGETEILSLVKVEKGQVILKGKDGVKRKFRASSLEEVDGEAYIVGKVDDEDDE